MGDSTGADIYVINIKDEPSNLGAVEVRNEQAKEPVRYAPLDGGWGWMCVLACFFISTLSAGLVVRSSGILFVSIVDYYGSSATDTAWVSALMMTLTFCMGPVMGNLAVRFSSRPVIFGSGLMIGLGIIISMFATDVKYLYITLGVIVGTGNSMAFSPSVGHINLYFKERASLAMGLSLCGTGVGSLVAGPFTTSLIDEYGLPGTFLILGGLQFNICVCAMLLRPLSFYEPKVKKKDISAEGKTVSEFLRPTTAKHTKAETGENVRELEPRSEGNLVDTRIQGSNVIDKEFAKATTEKYEPVNKYTFPHIPEKFKDQDLHGDIVYRKFDSFTPPKSENTIQKDQNEIERSPVILKGNAVPKKPSISWHVLRSGTFWVLSISMMLALIGFFNMTTILIPAHTDSIGLADDDYSMLVSIMGGSDIVGRILTGLFSNLNIMRKSIFYVITCSLSGVLICVVPSAGTNMILLSVICALFGLVGSSLPPLQPLLLLERIGGENLAGSMGFLHFVIGIPMIFSQPLAGYLFDSTGSWTTAFYYSGGTMIVAAVIMGIDEIRMHVGKMKRKAKVHLMT